LFVELSKRFQWKIEDSSEQSNAKMSDNFEFIENMTACLDQIATTPKHLFISGEESIRRLNEL
jgi:hypothetical protein